MSENGSDIEFYRVSKMSNEGGWRPVEGFEKLLSPISQDGFKHAAGDLEPGRYRLWGVSNNLNTPTDDGWDMTIEPDDTDDAPPTYYVAGQEVKLRGVSWEPRDAPTGGRYTDIVYHVQFPESERTREVEQVKVDGGAEALYDDLEARGMLPEWACEGLVPPWERDDVEGEF